jgi:DNA-binding NtrC family response regulator
LGQELHILIIEDDLADAIRLTHELKRRGLNFRSTRVETHEDFLSALDRQPPDLVLSDHGLPSFSGFIALEIVQQRCPQVPFIFVTGSHDQNMMVEMFDGGAAGYVFKNRLSELVPVIEQALEDARQRARRLAEETARQIAAAAPAAPCSEARTPRNLRPICGRCKRVRNDGGQWEPLESHLKQHRQATITLALCPACTMR